MTAIKLGGSQELTGLLVVVVVLFVVPDRTQNVESSPTCPCKYILIECAHLLTRSFKALFHKKKEGQESQDGARNASPFFSISPD